MVLMHSNRIKAKVKKDYNQIADEFTETRRSAWKGFQIFDEYYSPKSRVLDLGCGNGRLLKYLDKMGYRSYLGIDFSEKLIEHAKKNYPDSKFIVDDMSQVKHVKGRFDALFSIASLHHIYPSEQKRTLMSWKKHLEPGGILFMSNWNLRQKKYFPLWLRSLIRPTYGLSGVLVPWNNKVSRYYFSFSKRRLKTLLEESGFKILFHEYVKGMEKTNFWRADNIVTIAVNEKK